MGRGFVTAADVAAQAGVSRSAVSRTFTPGAYVSTAVRTRVLEAAEQVGYRVNRLAQSLIRDRSSLVGIIGANLGAPFNAALLSQIARTLPEAGLQCLLFDAANGAGGIASMVESILEYRAHALVILSGTPPNAIVAESLRRGLRVILVNKPMRGIAADTILSDDQAGARLAADRLIRAGARRLAVVASGSRTPVQRRRIAAFRRRAAEHGLAPIVWAEGETTYQTGANAAEALLRGKIDGVFCVTDLLALGFLDVARHVHGRRVPENLSVIGFDDIDAAGWRAYRLTTVRQSTLALADAVAASVLREGDQAWRLTVPVELIERATVRDNQEQAGRTP